jgi:hypothetical protein
MSAKKLNGIKIITKRPIVQPELCKKIVKIFKKYELQITIEEARHLWDLHSIDNGVGWITKAELSDKEIFDSFESYYIVDHS